MRQSHVKVCASTLLACLGPLVGCGERSSEESKYNAIWVDYSHANPECNFIDKSDVRSLINNTDYHEHRLLTTTDAITPELTAQMKEFGIRPNLSGLAAVLTDPLKAPEETLAGEFDRARWMLSTRNIFYTMSKNKSVDFHLDEDEIVILVLRYELAGTLTCYEEENGKVVEYMYVLPETRSSNLQ